MAKKRTPRSPPPKFRDIILANKDLLLKGEVLAIDPSSGGSSLPGWANFRAGALLHSGTAPLTQGATIQYRLAELYQFLQLAQPDVLLIEHCHGVAHIHLKWSVGVTLASTNPPLVIEVPNTWWKKVVGWTEENKTDEGDAIGLGTAVMMLARGEVEGE